jgi:hypothetical protein
MYQIYKLDMGCMYQVYGLICVYFCILENWAICHPVETIIAWNSIYDISIYTGESLSADIFF